MKPRSLLRIAALGVAVAVIGMAWKSGRPPEPAGDSAKTPDKVRMEDSTAVPLPEKPVPSVPVASSPDPGFTPGHFPGVSVRHEPGTHRPTPPAGTPRSRPVEEEIVLPDGRRLTGAALDETWRVPVTTEEQP